LQVQLQFSRGGKPKTTTRYARQPWQQAGRLTGGVRSHFLQVQRLGMTVTIPAWQANIGEDILSLPMSWSATARCHLERLIV
jgi:hypothetical protein